MEMERTVLTCPEADTCVAVIMMEGLRMPLAERRADLVWKGDLMSGSGSVKLASSGAAELPVTWASRVENPDGKTSPEELIAAAHASCYAMAFSNTLVQAGYQPEQLTVNAVCSLEKVEGGIQVDAMVLNVRGRVPGIDQKDFAELAVKGELGCPVSNALRNNVKISVNATLES
jgi:lipoyl-dependent peroxiredoxin